jgi:hypothetical protein
MVLARERYGFVPWVVLFLAVTWVSTLVFGRKITASAADLARAGVPRASEEAASYVTRTLYQETLFFLLPFYAYSTVLRSPNVVFVLLLASLALLSCLDLVFDRLLRTKPIFAMVFFATVAFAAVNLVLPMLWPMRPSTATAIAAITAVAGALPLSLQSGGTRRSRWLAGLAGSGLIATALFAPVLVPPVPLRMEDAVFSSGLERETLTPIAPLGSSGVVPAGEGALYVVVEVFAPSTIPAAVVLEWKRDGTVLRTSRDITLTAHASGFRVWDAWRSGTGHVPPGTYEVTVRTANGRIFGRAKVAVSG